MASTASAGCHSLAESIRATSKKRTKTAKAAAFVATADSHYVRREDAKAHEVLMCIASGKTFATINPATEEVIETCAASTSRPPFWARAGRATASAAATLAPYLADRGESAEDFFTGALGIVLLVTAFMTAYYTFRLYFRVFEGPLVVPPPPP